MQASHVHTHTDFPIPRNMVFKTNNSYKIRSLGAILYAYQIFCTENISLCTVVDIANRDAALIQNFLCFPMCLSEMYQAVSIIKYCYIPYSKNFGKIYYCTFEALAKKTLANPRPPCNLLDRKNFGGKNLAKALLGCWQS